jgi:hypothetical protein
MMSRFLQWRRDNNVDKIRQDIVEGGMDHPLKFPNGEKILGLIPQLVITPDAFDKMGAPICVDQYCFSPEEVLNKISIQEYIVFVMHCLEYRSLVVDQLSEQREREFLASHTKEELAALQDPDSESTYGVLLNTCVIRDLGAVGFEHVSSQGQEIIRAVVGLSTENYPELMRKCFMINTPWVFNALWYFIKGLLAARFVYSPSDDDDDDIFPRPNTHTHTHARTITQNSGKDFNNGNGLSPRTRKRHRQRIHSVAYWGSIQGRDGVQAFRVGQGLPLHAGHGRSAGTPNPRSSPASPV